MIASQDPTRTAAAEPADRRCTDDLVRKQVDRLAQVCNHERCSTALGIRCDTVTVSIDDSLIPVDLILSSAGFTCSPTAGTVGPSTGLPRDATTPL